MKNLIAEIVNTRDYENLRDRLGKDLGDKIYSLVDMAQKADQELNTCHEVLTELYNIDLVRDIIKKALSDIDKINKKP